MKKILVYFPTSFVLSSYCYFAFLEKMKGSEWDGGETLQIEIFVLQHFFLQKKMEKTCPNIILISSKWSTECFKSDGRKTLQIEIFVLQHFFRKKTLETYVQISLQWFWNDPLNVLKAIVERCCSRWNFSISRWIEIFYFAFFLVWSIFFLFATVVPLWFPGVVPRCVSP